MTTADLLRAIQHRTALCRELWITPVTLYRYVGPQGQVRERTALVDRPNELYSGHAILREGSAYAQRMGVAVLL